MASTQRIKESYGPPVLPKNATPEERQRILQEHRKHQDLIRQLNDTRIAQDGNTESLQELTAVLRLIGKPIVMGRTVTDGAGGFISSVLRGGSASIAGARLRITFDSPRRRDSSTGQPSYVPFAIALTGGNARFYTATNITQPTFCDFVCRVDTGLEVSHALVALSTAIAIFDAD